METAIFLSNGMQFNLTTPSYSAEEFAKNLNNNNIQMLTVGNVSINKTAISYVAPKVTPDNANVSVYLNNGNVLKTYINEFDANDISTLGNNPIVNVIAIGDIAINKHMVMMVVPIEMPQE